MKILSAAYNNSQQTQVEAMTDTDGAIVIDAERDKDLWKTLKHSEVTPYTETEAFKISTEVGKGRNQPTISDLLKRIESLESQLKNKGT